MRAPTTYVVAHAAVVHAVRNGRRAQRHAGCVVTRVLVWRRMWRGVVARAGDGGNGVDAWRCVAWWYDGRVLRGVAAARRAARDGG